MKKRNIEITLETAKEWYNSNIVLKDIALQAFSEEELKYNFKDIKTFEDACKVLNICYKDVNLIIASITMYSKASAAMFKLNIIRKALNLGQDLHLTKDPEHSNLYYPRNHFITNNCTYYEGELNTNKFGIIGRIKYKGEVFKVLNNCSYTSSNIGLGCFNFGLGIGYANTNFGFLGCASEEIAQHFSKYFGMLITEAKYSDLPDFQIIERKYE